MNVNLTPELTQLVQKKVQTGLYNSASEVVREALRMMEERDQIKAIQKEEIRTKIAAGLSSARAGRVSDGETFVSRMIGELEAEIRAEDEKSLESPPAIS